MEPQRFGHNGMIFGIYRGWRYSSNSLLRWRRDARERTLVSALIRVEYYIRSTHNVSLLPLRVQSTSAHANSIINCMSNKSYDMSVRKPYSNTSLIPYLEKRILELRPAKSQAEIASQAGFANVNMMSMIKSGATRLPLDRVPALAAALDVDPARLLQLAIEQWAGSSAARSFDAIFETIVTQNEVGWLNEIRDASGNSDPVVTTRARSAIRAIFGK
jgi:hypothetical protein